MRARAYECEAAPGIRGIVLDSGIVELTVLPDKGADLYRFVDKCTCIDVLSKSPWGFSHMPGRNGQRHDARRVEADPKLDWLDRVPGGWQTMCPNVGMAGNAEGVYYPHHGEAGTLPWTVTELTETAQSIRLRLMVNLTILPLSLDRTIELAAGSGSFEVSDKLTNNGAKPVPFAWGQHPSFGYPFLDEGTFIQIAAKTVSTHDIDHPVKQFPPSDSWLWPYAKTKSGRAVDLSVIPDCSEKRWELLWLSDLEQGSYTIVNPKLQLQFRLEWPLSEWPYIWLWQELGGTQDYPYCGRGYAFGLEPASIPPTRGIEWAVQRRAAAAIGPGETREAKWRASLSSF